LIWHDAVYWRSPSISSDEFDRYNRKIGFWAATKGEGKTKSLTSKALRAPVWDCRQQDLLDTFNCTCHGFQSLDSASFLYCVVAKLRRLYRHYYPDFSVAKFRTFFFWAFLYTLPVLKICSCIDFQYWYVKCISEHGLCLLPLNYYDKESVKRM